ncbi:hypothetical protein KI387_014903, partial [Taxus chinensis]
MKNNKVEYIKVIAEVTEKRDLIKSMKDTLEERLKEIYPLVQHKMATLEGVASYLDMVAKELKEK